MGGKNPIRMDDLKAVFESLKHRKVATYQQSGNVLFESDHAEATGIARTIEAALSSRFGGPIPVLIRDVHEMTDIVTKNPLLSKKGNILLDKLHVTFLKETKTQTDIADLEPKKDPAEQIAIHGREAFLYCPNGYGRTRLNNQVIEKALHTVATTRNWKTACALWEMMKEMEAAPAGR